MSDKSNDFSEGVDDVARKMSTLSNKVSGRDKYSNIALSAIDELLQEVIKDISSTRVEVDTNNLFSFH